MSTWRNYATSSSADGLDLQRPVAVPTALPLHAGGRCAYVDEGARSAHAVLLLHGNPTWSFLWRHVIAALVSAGQRVIAPICWASGVPTSQRNWPSTRLIATWFDCLRSGTRWMFRRCRSSSMIGAGRLACGGSKRLAHLCGAWWSAIRLVSCSQVSKDRPLRSTWRALPVGFDRWLTSRIGAVISCCATSSLEAGR